MFEPFPKIARLNRNIVISEKIDGTNAQVFILNKIEEGYAERVGLPVIAESPDAWMFAGSRTRFITPTEDNHGFAKWVAGNASELFTLGPGRHFGEWWGSGIQRGYGLQKGEKRFSLFNTGRWYAVDTEPQSGVTLSPAPTCCHVVPVLYNGPYSQEVIDFQLTKLRVGGSVAAPDFDGEAEGIVLYHEAARQLFKVTLEDDEVPKGNVEKQRVNVSA